MAYLTTNQKPTIFYDLNLQQKYAGILHEIGCDSCGISLQVKHAHFLIPPNLAVYILDPNADLKEIFGQVQQFRQNFPHRIIIIEGIPDETHTQIFCGIQMRLWLQDHDAMQPSLNGQETCMILKSLAVRLQIKDNPPTMNRPKPKTDLKLLHLNLLEGLIETGSQKAAILLNFFGSALTVIETIKQEPERILELRGFGSEFLHSNDSLLYEPKPS